MSDNPYQENADRGAAVLDTEQPGWWRNIHTATLDMEEGFARDGEDFSHACVLCQTYGVYYFSALQTLFDYSFDTTRNEFAIEHGFTLDDNQCNYRENWLLLNNAWLKLILDRQLEASIQELRELEEANADA